MEEIGRLTLQENFAKITGSPLDPGTLADELFQRQLINKATTEEASSPYVPKSRRLHAIVMAVMGNGSPGAFRAFVEAVRKDQASAWLAQALIDTYRSRGGRWEDGTTPPQYPPSLTRSPPPPAAIPAPRKGTPPAEEELEDSPFFPDDGKRIMRDDGEEVKYVRYEPHPTSKTGKLKSMTLSFDKVNIDRQKPQKHDPYEMKADPHGIAIIINNKEFVKLRNREGTDIDEANLIETLRYHRYIVHVYRDCTTAKMLEIFEEVRQMDHKGYDSFICCILSHGKEGHVYGSDGEIVGLSAIKTKLNARNCASLALKPKMFFVQACRGSKRDPVVRITVDSASPGEEEVDQSDPQSRIEDDGPTIELPSEADFLFSYSSPYGQASFRDLDHGSWYISELCRALCCSSTHLHLNDMLLQVNKKVGEMEYKYRQAPEVTHLLRHNVYF